MQSERASQRIAAADGKAACPSDGQGAAVESQRAVDDERSGREGGTVKRERVEGVDRGGSASRKAACRIEGDIGTEQSANTDDEVVHDTERPGVEIEHAATT